MAKMELQQIRNIIGREEFDHVSLASALASYSAVDQKINEMLKSGQILRVKKGLYVFGPQIRQTIICRETLANLIYGPSYISMEYALAYYGLIPERVETVTSVTSKREKKFDTPLGTFTYQYLNPRKYPHEIEQRWIDQSHPILIASPEKALFDYVTINEVPTFANAKAGVNFLREDLRMDDEAIARLDIKKMIRINSYYRSQNMTRIMEGL
ncbi:MAG TPA: hypothetical protein V6C97_12730 [Oculatellaceae cyanobacterium]